MMVEIHTISEHPCNFKSSSFKVKLCYHRDTIAVCHILHFSAYPRRCARAVNDKSNDSSMNINVRAHTRFVIV